MLVFIDDSGDSGFKIDKGATSHFVIAVVVFDDPLEAERAAVDIKTLRRSLGFRDADEFKFFRSRDEVKKRFLETIEPRAFKVQALVVDKSKIRSEELRTDKRSFYAFFIKTALKQIGGGIRGAKIWIDGIGDRGFRREFTTYLRHEMRADGSSPAFKSIRFVDSKDNVLIQMADMVAGAVLRKYAKQDDKYYRIIKTKIIDERSFR